MNVVVTGADGFLGWHLACRLRATHALEPRLISRSAFNDTARLGEALTVADVVFHLAGVNRGDTDIEVERGNVEIAQRLAFAIRAVERPLRVVYADSVQSLDDSPYGRGKAAARDILADSVAVCGGSLADVILPNLFGEHGRPHYNSFVATFCHLVASGGEPEVTDDREVSLLHAQRAATSLIAEMHGPENSVTAPSGVPMLISSVLDRVRSFEEVYVTGELPSLVDPFDVDLFNTYRSHLFPQRWPMHPPVHADARGWLFETSRARGGTSQTFVSTTRPGRTRGDHYHLRKIERFFVVSGHAEISVRRLLSSDVVTFRLHGDRPGFVDMPTLWTHKITNVGDSDLVTMFWSDQLFDAANPDQYAESVCQEGMPA